MISRRFYAFFAIILIGAFAPACIENSRANRNGANQIISYLSTSDGAYKFSQVAELISSPNEQLENLIHIDKTKKYQSMAGFGFNLTGGSAMHIGNMSKDKRKELLQHLFDTKDENIGISYIRISIGASDLDKSVFSYNDLPKGATDYNLEHFSIDADRQYLIPLLKEILVIYPGLQIMASPWSPPAWMKTNGASMGGNLKKDCYDAYALYFEKYIRAMEAEGVQISTITVQNEPLHPGNNPSMYMSSDEQLIFIRDHLGPRFKKSNIKTKILLFDHNADHTEYPMHILNDPEAKQYVDGSAFHLYGGDVSALSKVHEAHPDKNLYFTEQWTGAPGNFAVDMRWHIKNLIIGASRNWCKNVLEWNLAADSNHQPHTDGGCSRCLGALTIDGDNVEYNPSYYIIAHASKHVRPGSVRIASDLSTDLPNVAFLTPENEVVLILLNDSNESVTFNVREEYTQFSGTLAEGSAATFIWSN